MEHSSSQQSWIELADEEEEVVSSLDLSGEEDLEWTPSSELEPTVPVESDEMDSVEVVAPEPEVPVVPGGPFRLQAKTLYLTYPRCEVTAAECLNRIQEYFPELDWAVVGRELHQDGTPHLHCLIKLQQRYTTRRPSDLDALAGKHGNYQACRNLRRCLEYVLKDGRYVQVGIDAKAHLAAMRQHKARMSDVVAKKVIDGTSIRAITADAPGYVMMNLQKIRSFQSFVRSQRPVDRLPLPRIGFLGLSSKVLSIWTWITNNVRQDRPRPLGQPQLFIVGNTGLGKTSLINCLRPALRIYYPPASEDFYDMYDDSEYDLIVFDEFYHSKTITFMNSFVEGSPVTLRTKGGQLMKEKNLPVIVLSNYTPAECYSRVALDRPHILETFTRRFRVVNLEGSNLFELISRIETAFESPHRERR